MKRSLAPLLFAATLAAATDAEILQLIQQSKSPKSPAFRQALTAAVAEKQLLAGTAVYHGGEFLYVLQSDKPATLQVNDAPAKLTKAGNLFLHRATLPVGRSHSMQWTVDGETRTRQDYPAYLPGNYETPGVPKGTLSEKMIGTSKIYPGLKYDWWTYVPAQYDGSTPMAVMIWQDGQGHVTRDGQTRTLNVVDNLIHQKKIPVMIQIFIAPGNVEGKAWRSIEYDSVNDTYPRYLRDEILAEVAKKYKIRTDAYSRGIAGNSSGGICAFNAAWFMPDQFARVLSRIGSFTSIQWRPGQLDGGNVYPNMVRKQPKRNIRVWMSDGSEDLENNHGSWPLQNIQLANSLKMREYDFHFVFGNAQHNGAQGNAEAPAAMEWLWRGYDPAKTSEEFAMDPAEKAKPYWRVKALNR